MEKITTWNMFEFWENGKLKHGKMEIVGQWKIFKMASDQIEQRQSRLGTKYW